MPFYTYYCQFCESIQDGYRHISERHNGPECCGHVAQMCIVPPAVTADLPGYESPVTGKWIEGRAARREDLRRTGCRPYESGEREEHQRQMKYQEKKDDAIRHEAVARAFYSLPESKRRALTRG